MEQVVLLIEDNEDDVFFFKRAVARHAKERDAHVRAAAQDRRREPKREHQHPVDALQAGVLQL